MSRQVFLVYAQVRPPIGDDPGHVVEGRYIVELAPDGTGVVTLTNRAGEPVRDQLGRFYRQKVSEKEAVHAIAALLTKQLRSVLLGKDQATASRQLDYPKVGYA